MRFLPRFPISACISVGLALLVVMGAPRSATDADPPRRSRLDIVAAVMPAIVTVVAEGVAARGAPTESPDAIRSIAGGSTPAESPDERRRLSFTQPAENDTGTSIGTGFILTKNGTIATSEHVVHQAERISVRLADGSMVPAELVGSDEIRDVAVLRIDATRSLPSIEWGRSRELRIGDEILIFGNTFGLGVAASLGMVSALDRDLGLGPLDDFIQVDAALNDGDSGGPIIDGNGHVVGIDTAIYSPTGVSAGVGFAIPSDDARPVVEAILRGRPPSYGRLGIHIADVSEDVRSALGLERSDGALVLGVVQASPASKAGLTASDILVSLDGSAIPNARELSRRVVSRQPGTRASVEVLRAGHRLRFDVTIAKVGDQTEPSSGDDHDALDLSRFGLSVTNSPLGVFVTDITAGAAAESIGIAPGDFVLSVNQKPVVDTAGFSREIDAAIAAGRSGIVVAVRRGVDEDVATLPLND